MNEIIITGHIEHVHNHQQENDADLAKELIAHNITNATYLTVETCYTSWTIPFDGTVQEESFGTGMSR